jgi:hypothetical protein
MRLRHVILLASGAGAAGALLLAADIHRRVQEAQRDSLLNNTPISPDSVVYFGEVHMLGLLALAFLFLATVLLILAEPKPAAEPGKTPVTPAAPELAVSAQSTPASHPAPATAAPSNDLPAAGFSDERHEEQ